MYHAENNFATNHIENRCKIQHHFSKKKLKITMISMKCTDRPAFLREFADLYHQEQYFSNISVHQSHLENVNSDMAGTHRQGV